MTKGAEQPAAAPINGAAFDFSVKDLAAVFDVSPRRIQAWTKEGMPKLSHGRYDVRICVQWKLAQQADVLQSPDGLLEDRRALIVQQTERCKVETEKLRGDLVDVEAVRHVVQEVVAICASQLDALPARVAASLIGIQEPAIIQDRLLRETNQVRQAIGTAIANFAQQGIDR